MIELASAAQAAASLGPVLPVMPSGKAPAIKRGLLGATRDRDRIRSWWASLPLCNIGVRTGDGLLVVDLDVKNGTSGISELMAHAWGAGAEDREYLQTYRVATPSGGLHLYYRTGAEIPSRVGVLPGVDIRGESGYAVAAYSRTDSGPYVPEAGYREELDLGTGAEAVLTRFDTDMLPAPGWLEDLALRRPEPVLRDPEPVRNPGPYLKAVLDVEALHLQAARPGERNEILNRTAYRIGKQVRAGRLTEAQAEDWLHEAASHLLEGEDPLTPSEVARTVASGLRGGISDD